MKSTKKLDLLIGEITDKKIVSTFTRIGKVFYDEPSMYFFTANLSDNPEYYEKMGYTLHHHLSSCGGAGLSFDSEYLAVLKSLAEAVERFSAMVYNKKNIVRFPYTHAKGSVLDLSEFDVSPDGKTWNWVQGRDLMTDTPCYIPAQLAYLTNVAPGEPPLTVRNSTGTASGFDYDAVLLRGLYEVIERDCFITAYYNRIPLRRIRPESIMDESIQNLISTCKRYRLGLSLFDMENDLQLPAYLAVVTDETGHGPAVSAGMKAGMNRYETIRDCIQEAFISRLKMRYETYIKNLSSFRIKAKEIHDHIARGLYWYPVTRLAEIKWLLGLPEEAMGQVPKPLGTKAQLDIIRRRLKQKNLSAYYCDLTLSNFKEISFYTLKVIVPGLQPLHIDEDDKLLRSSRLSEVARYFGKKPKHVNTSPHFF